ncbi:hypothetical protein IJH74_01565 [Candidatus Saccharibacteria bacterium]|nr:hypothetical protein [Candidatus Saccharibacteria bacterium]
MSKSLRVLYAIVFALGANTPTLLASATEDNSAIPTASSTVTSESENESPPTEDSYEPISPASAEESIEPEKTDVTTDSDESNASDPDGTNPTSSDYFNLLKEHLFIKSINPGFKINDVSETGEAIELENSSNFSLPLDNLSLRYINSNGNVYPIFEFPSGSFMIEKDIVLRLDKSPEIKNILAETGSYREIADVIYSKTLAMNGSLELVYTTDDGEQVLDSICWTGKSGCAAKFTNNSPGTLVRDSKTREITFRENYIPNFVAGFYLPEDTAEPTPENSLAPVEVKTVTSKCKGLGFTELLSYYEENSSEQFLELYNPTDEIINMSGCQVKYKNKYYQIVTTNASIENNSISELYPSEFYVYRPDKFTFTKNPNSENKIELIDTTGDTLDTLTYPHGQKKGTAYALTDNLWRTTYTPTPGSANFYQEFQTCPFGKVLNSETGNCVKASTISSVTPCPAGKYRNPETGRCKSASSASSEPTPCKEGYERNPETNRCRKVKTNSGADYALVPVTGDPDKTSFIAFWALVALAGLSVLYIIFQFRKDLYFHLRKFIARIKRS